MLSGDPVREASGVFFCKGVLKRNVWHAEMSASL